mmetsp:Transcript_18288/g.55707  ORF Transcript_18288/g.55707 Transcript_18288/m.55707 type:complete len:370 (-) Transcript_18288:415-1524(-)
MTATASSVRFAWIGGFLNDRSSSSCVFLMPWTAFRALNNAGSAWASSSSAAFLRDAMSPPLSASSADSCLPRACLASAACWSATIFSSWSRADASCASNALFWAASSPCIAATSPRARANSRSPAALRFWVASSASRLAVASAAKHRASSTKSRHVARDAARLSSCVSTSAATTADSRVGSVVTITSSSSSESSDSGSSRKRAARSAERPSAHSAAPIAPKSTVFTSAFATFVNAFVDHVPNQSTTHRLKSAGLAVARSASPPEPPGLRQKTTCRFRRTFRANHRRTAASSSSAAPSDRRASRHAASNRCKSSAPHSPGTSPDASSAFIRSRKADEPSSASSSVTTRRSRSTPARRIAARRSSSNLAGV